MSASRPESFTLQRSGTNYDPISKVWSGVDIVPLYNPNVTVGQVLVNALSKHPQMVGQICHEDGYEMKNWEILRDSVRVSLNLRDDCGLKERDVLGFAAGNSRNTASIVFGALLNGIPVSTLDPYFQTGDIKHIFGITLPKLVVCEKVNFSKVKDALKELHNPAPIYVIDGEDDDNTHTEWKSVQELLKAHPEESDFVPPKFSDGVNLPAFILCSSGTTGALKAIPCSHAVLNYKIQGNIGFPIGIRCFTFSTLFWLTGLLNLLFSTAGNFVRVIVNRRFEGKLFLDIIRHRQPTYLMCTPAHLHLLLLEKVEEEDLKSLLVIFCGGSAASESLIKGFKVPISMGYGLTESLGVIQQGRLASRVAVKIVDDCGNNLQVGEKGEIWVKPPFPFLGYYRNERATQDILNDDGYLRTGDVGLFDESGDLKVLDRKKEIFKSNYVLVNPSDIENDLQNIGGVGLVAVVPIPHEAYSNVPAAVIVRSKGARDVQITEVDVHKYTKEHLPQHKWLRGGVYFVDDLPMTVSGKVLRRVVQERTIELYGKKANIGFEY